MEKYPFFMAILCVALTSRVLGYPYGNVSIACDSMLPDHGSAPQKSTPPYVISVSFDRYDPGNEIQVILEGTSPSGFKGFMVQAREVDGNVPVGSFHIIDANTQGLPCANISNSAVSHLSPNVKHRVTTIWVAPSGTKKIRLMATFVQDYDTYWVGVHSKTLSPRHSDAMNASRNVNNSVTTNSSAIARDSVTSVVSEIIADSDASSENHGYIDLNTLLAESETDDGSGTPSDSEMTQDSEEKNATARNRRKSVVTVRVDCGEKGAVQSTSGGCIKSTQGSSQSQSSGSQSKVIVVKQGGSSGCAGGGIAGVYNKYGCRDSAAGIGSQSSYGQSVSTGTKVKVVSYPDSKPFPPERGMYPSKIANSKYSGIIHSQSSSSSKIQIQGGQIISGGSSVYSQGSRPQGGSSQDIRITIQSGKGNPACDKGSASYNIVACNQGQSSSSQSGSYSGTQGQSSSSQSSSPGTQSGSYSSGSNPCGQGTTYDSNPCNQGQSSSSQQSTYSNQGQSSSSQQGSYSNQASSQYQGNSNACIQGKDAASYNNNNNNNRC